MSLPPLLDRPAIDTEFARIVDELTRRGFLAGGLGTAALAALAACGSSDPADGSSSGPAGPWSYTDDTGQRIDLPARPVRIAVLGDSLGASLWAAGLHVIASPGQDAVYTEVGVSAEQLAGIATFGTEDGQSYNVEALLKARPDLIVGNADGHAVFALKSQPELAKVAPVLGLNLQTQSFTDIMASIDRFVGAAGAVDDSASKQQYQAQADRLETAVATKPGLRMVACFDLGADGLGLEIVERWPELQTLTALGMNVTPATGAADQYFTTISWENVPDIKADLLVNVAGSGKLPANPAWSKMSAVQAGQVLNVGSALSLYTYANYAEIFTRLTSAVTAAHVVAPD